jgi:hypothetical protein
VVVTATLAIALPVLAVRDPALAARIAAEGHLLESLQAALLGASAFLSATRAFRRARAGAPRALEVLLTVLIASVVSGELDLDLRLFGIRIIHTRFFVSPAVWLPYRVVAALGLGAFYGAIAWYCIRHRRPILAAARGLPARPWGQLLLTGLLVFGLVQVFEDPLGRVAAVPRFFLEESLELIGAVYIVFATIDGVRSPVAQPGAATVTAVEFPEGRTTGRPRSSGG